jgi:hypothetical protein
LLQFKKYLFGSKSRVNTTDHDLFYIRSAVFHIPPSALLSSRYTIQITAAVHLDGGGGGEKRGEGEGRGRVGKKRERGRVRSLYTPNTHIHVYYRAVKA